MQYKKLIAATTLLACIYLLAFTGLRPGQRGTQRINQSE
ncbi:hypothetical protein JCM19231_2769 [Vibrio ishigakensis]|uniref:Uncharacterized protein n=1 Tax=Vibrio ishigakensis TaxID=1481914 RepID=A0A0B8NXM5_9VIBR|nr:hypothetical protein JCM19231_2769 [Vibrio ishigakensis]